MREELWFKGQADSSFKIEDTSNPYSYPSGLLRSHGLKIHKNKQNITPIVELATPK